MKFSGLSQEQEEAQSNEGSRQDNFKILTEFVPHVAALGFDGGNGGIGNNGQVVTKHGATDHGTGANGHGKASLLTDAGSNGSQRRNRTHASTHGYGNKAANNKKSRYCHATRQDGKAQVYSAFHATCGAHSTGEGACCEENKAHSQNVFIANARRAQAQLLDKA